MHAVVAAAAQKGKSAQKGKVAAAAPVIGFFSGSLREIARTHRAVHCVVFTVTHPAAHPTALCACTSVVVTVTHPAARPTALSTAPPPRS